MKRLYDADRWHQKIAQLVVDRDMHMVQKYSEGAVVGGVRYLLEHEVAEWWNEELRNYAVSLLRAVKQNPQIISELIIEIESCG